MSPEKGKAQTLQILNRLLSRNETAALLGCSVAALRRWDRLGCGPTPTRLGRLVRYSPKAILEFLESNSQAEEKPF